MSFKELECYNLLDLDGYNLYCITTNGCLNNDDHLVMGRGIALTAKQKFPDLPKILGTHVKKIGNIPCLVKSVLNYDGYLCSFPTKYHFREKSNIKLIEKSCIKLLHIVRENNFNNIILPRPGCGLGGLNYENEVKPILLKYFDDKFTLAYKKDNEEIEFEKETNFTKSW